MICNLNDICQDALSYCSKFSLETFCLCLKDNMNKFCDTSFNFLPFFNLFCILFFICNVFFCACRKNIYNHTDKSFVFNDSPPTYTEAKKVKNVNETL